MGAFFDLIAPIVNDAIAFGIRFWPSLLVMASAVALALAARRAPRLPLPPAGVQFAVVCALSLAASAVTFHFCGPPPMPGYEDDFGYLLAADTFLHGRLTNPQHPLTPHFETLYTLHEPTYSAIYPPGNALVLALGRLVAGRALAGMWLATALAAMAVLWALRGWISEGWAVALACLAAVHPTMAAWSDSFHGGSLAACGGALVAGAAGRLRREPRTIDGIAFGVGAVILELTRPYEGLVVAAAFAIIAMVSGHGRRLLRPTAAALFLTCAGAAAMMVMNHQITGDALKLPYVAYNERYLSAPNFIWQAAGRPPAPYAHPEYARLYRQFRDYYFRNREPREFMRAAYAETAAILRAAIPAPRNERRGAGRAADSLWLLEITPFAVFLFAALRDRSAAVIAAALAAALASLLAITWFTQPHYAAPSVGVFAIAVGMGLARLDAMRSGQWLSRAAFAAMLVAALIANVESWRTQPVGERTQMIEAMMRVPGPHLVLVSESCFGFLRNGAEIDRQRIIWARDLGTNDELLRRYAGRSLWVLRCDSRDQLAFVRPPLRSSASQSYERDPYIR